MPQADVPSRRERTLAYLTCYGLLLVLLLLDVILLFVWRLTFLILVARYTAPSAANNLLYIPLVLLGMVLFVSLIGAEGYLRDGVERQQLRRRFMRFAVPLIVLLLLALLLRGVAAL